MIAAGEHHCPNCGGYLKYYDKVDRIVCTKGRKRLCIKIKRFRCTGCGKMHRAIPGGIMPYKHYEAEMITGVLEGVITPDTLGFEDYPCEATMLRWTAEFNK